MSRAGVTGRIACLWAAGGLRSVSGIDLVFCHGVWLGNWLDYRQGGTVID